MSCFELGGGYLVAAGILIASLPSLPSSVTNERVCLCGHKGVYTDSEIFVSTFSRPAAYELLSSGDCKMPCVGETETNTKYCGGDR